MTIKIWKKQTLSFSIMPWSNAQARNSSSSPLRASVSMSDSPFTSYDSIAEKVMLIMKYAMVIDQKLIKMSCCNNFTRLHNYYFTFLFHTVSFQIIKNAVWVLVNKYHISAIVVNQSKDPRNCWSKCKVVPSSIIYKNKLAPGTK